MHGLARTQFLNTVRSKDGCGRIGDTRTGDGSVRRALSSAVSMAHLTLRASVRAWVRARRDGELLTLASRRCSAGTKLVKCMPQALRAPQSMGRGHERPRAEQREHRMAGALAGRESPELVAVHVVTPGIVQVVHVGRIGARGGVWKRVKTGRIREHLFDGEGSVAILVGVLHYRFHRA